MKVDGKKQDVVLLQAADVQARIRASRSMVYKLISCGAIPSIRLGRSVRVPAAALDLWIERNTVGGEANQ